MKKFYLIAAAVLVASLASCSKQSFPEAVSEFQEGQEVAFTVSKLTKSTPKTKVSHEFNEDTTQLVNKWEANDAIKLYNAKYASVWGKNDGKFQIVDPEADPVVFNGVAEKGTPTKAVYPYEAKIHVSEGGEIESIDLPTPQGGLGREAAFIADYKDGDVNFTFKPFHSMVVVDREAFLKKIGAKTDEFNSFTVTVVENDGEFTTKEYSVYLLSEARNAKCWSVAIDPVKTSGTLISIELPNNNSRVGVKVNPGKDGQAVAYNITDVVVNAVPEGFVDLGVINSAHQKVFWSEKNLLDSTITYPQSGVYSDYQNGTYYMFGFPQKIYSSYNTLGTITFISPFNQTNGFTKDSYPTAYMQKYFDVTRETSLEVDPSLDPAYKKNNNWRTPSQDDWQSMLDQCVFVINKHDGTITVYKAKDETHKTLTVIAENADDIRNWKNLKFYKYLINDYGEVKGDNYSEAYTDETPHITLSAAGYIDGTTRKYNNDIHCLTRTSPNGKTSISFGNTGGDDDKNFILKVSVDNAYPQGVTLYMNPYVGKVIRPVAYGDKVE